MKNFLKQNVKFLKPRSLSKIIVFALMAAMSSMIYAQTVVSKNGRLRVSGNHVVNKNNQQLSLAGNSLFWSTAGDTADFYNATTVNHLANNWKSSIIRAAMGVDESWDNGSGYIGSPNAQLTKIKKVIDAAISKGIYVIVDFHTHNAENYTNEAKTFFRDIAMTYGNSPNIIYEIYNEPINQSWFTIKNYAQAVIAEIRAYDPDNLIIVGTPFYSQNVVAAANNPINDINTAYTLHFYAGHPDHHLLRAEATKAMNKGIALFVTEWGTVDASGNGGYDETETDNWITFLKNKKISHVNWAVCDKNESASVVISNQGVNGLLTNKLTESGLKVKEIIGAAAGNNSSNGNPIFNLKKKGFNYYVDGNNGAENYQGVYLYDKRFNDNQKWEEINQGGGFYSYRKKGTNYALDGGNGGAAGNPIYLYIYSPTNQNQHWKKISTGNGHYVLQKRNATSFAIDGGNGAGNAQALKLWYINLNNVNQHWRFDQVGGSTNKGVSDLAEEVKPDESKDLLIYPNPVSDILSIEQLPETTKQINIYNYNGKLIKSQEIALGTTLYNLNTTEFSAGFYLLEIIADTTITKKFIKK